MVDLSSDYEALIFDLGGVIFSDTSGLGESIGPLVDEGSSAVYEKLRNSDLFYDLLKGEISEDEYWNQLIDSNDWDVERSELKKNVRLYFQPKNEVLSLVEELSQYEGLKMGVLSAHVEEWVEHLHEAYMYQLHFDEWSYSFEDDVDSIKPSRERYEKIVEKLDVDPSRALYIDDREKNLKPARDMGMDTIRFEDADQIKRAI